MWPFPVFRAVTAKLAMTRYQRAISSAAELGDPHHALRLVGRSARGPGHGASSGEWPVPRSRRRKKLLAGMLLRAGEAEAAGRVLASGAGTERVPQADAVIVDPGFIQLGGHHLATNQFHKQLIESQGLSVSVARSIVPPPGLRDDGIGSVAAFSLSSYEAGLSPSSLTQELQAFNDLFFHELQRGLPARGVRLIVAHSLRATFAEGLSRYLQDACRAGPVSALLGILEFADRSEHPDSEAIRAVYREAFGVLRSIPNLRLLITTETAELADLIRDVAGPEPEILILPYVGSFLDDIGAPDRADRAPDMTVGFIGASRPERGAHLIPEVAEATLAACPKSLVWRAQVTLWEGAPEGAAASLQRLAREKRFELFEPGLSTEAYDALLSSIDIMVLPYSEQYETRGSGIAFECLRAGCVQVVPERSSMAALARAHGAGLVTFQDPAHREVTNAVIEAVEHFPELSQKSRKAAEAALCDRTAHARLERFFQAV